MKKITLLFSVLCSMFIAATAQVNQTIVYDFTNNAFNIPTDAETAWSGLKQAAEFTDGTNSFKFEPFKEIQKEEVTNEDGEKETIDVIKSKGSIYYSAENGGYIRLGYPGTKIIFPAFDFAVEKIELVGNSKGGTSVDMNVYVGSKAVSTATTGTRDTYTYEIAEGYQEKGNVYEMVIGDKGGPYSSYMYISKILVHPKASEDALTVQAPEFDKAAGVYTEPITVTAYSQTANVEGVSNVIYYYTTNGYEPDEECDETEDGKIEINYSCTLKVVVSFEYNGETYTSESTTAEYIISEPVKAKIANEIEPGHYFIAAEGHIATGFKEGVILSKEIKEIGDGTITDAEYFLYSVESGVEAAENDGLNFLLKDANNNYIRIDVMGTTPKLQTLTSPDFCDLKISVMDNIARISSSGYFLVFDKESNCFKVTNTINDQTIFPTLYRLADETTAIDEVKGENSIEAIYDLTGRKIDNITKPGIYIVNGNKVLVK